MLELNAWIAKAIGRERSLCPVPASIASLIALLPGGPITRDQLAMLGRDNVAAPGAKGLADLGVAPTPMPEIGRAHVGTPVTNDPRVSSLMIEKKQTKKHTPTTTL